MRAALKWLLLAAVLLIFGVFPALADGVGAGLGIAVKGGLALLAQPPVLLLVLLAVFWPRRPKPVTT